MAMGQTGTVNITPDMMNNALNAISDYRTLANSHHTQLTSTVTTLIPGSFSGSAADGFKAFYEGSIEPIFGDEGLNGLLNALEQMVQGILEAIPQEGVGLDDQLGEGNRQTQQTAE